MSRFHKAFRRLCVGGADGQQVVSRRQVGDVERHLPPCKVILQHRAAVDVEDLKRVDALRGEGNGDSVARRVGRDGEVGRGGIRYGGRQVGKCCVFRLSVISFLETPALSNTFRITILALELTFANSLANEQKQFHHPSLNLVILFLLWQFFKFR